MNAFSSEMEKMNMKDEMWNDMVDMFDGDDIDAEADTICDQVLNEIGLEIGHSMMSAPSRAPDLISDEDEVCK